jgi:NADH-quinone oxidoreductase subunit G
VVELSPRDAERLGLGEGDQVELGSPVLADEVGRGNGTRVRGPVRLRAAVPHGSVFIAEGTPDQPSNVLTESLVEIVRVGGADAQPGAAAIQSTPAVEGLAEAPPSAPLEIPPTGPSQSGHDT